MRDHARRSEHVSGRSVRSSPRVEPETDERVGRFPGAARRRGPLYPCGGQGETRGKSREHSAGAPTGAEAPPLNARWVRQRRKMTPAQRPSAENASGARCYEHLRWTCVSAEVSVPTANGKFALRAPVQGSPSGHG